MDYFDSKVYKMKNYIDEINLEIEDLKKVNIFLTILLFVKGKQQKEKIFIKYNKQIKKKSQLLFLQRKAIIIN